MRIERKRLLSGLLALCMTFTMLPTAAFATEDVPQTGVVDSGEQPLTCGKTEHQHTLADCYTLICEQEESEEHTHSIEGGCYELTCTQEEHSHTEDCYGQETAAPEEKPAYSEDYLNVVALFEALPGADSITAETTEEEKDTINAQAAYVLDLFEKLSDEDYALFMKEHPDALQAVNELQNALIGDRPVPNTLGAEAGTSTESPLAVPMEGLAFNEGIIYGLSKSWYEAVKGNASDVYLALTIPAEIDGVPVTKIWLNAFSHRYLNDKDTYGAVSFTDTSFHIVSVDFSQATNLTHIYDQAFDERVLSTQYLTGVLDLSSTKLVQIDHAVFANTKITGVILPDTLEVLGNSSQGEVFSGCEDMEYIRLKSSGTDIKFELPTTLTTIGKQTFKNCFAVGSGITGIIPANVATIGSEAFYSKGFYQLQIARTADYSGFNKAAFKYPNTKANPNLVVFPSATAYAEIAKLFGATSTYMTNGGFYAIPTYKLTVNFKRGNNIVRTEQKVYNQCIDYVKDTDGVWRHDTAYVLPESIVSEVGYYEDWFYEKNTNKSVAATSTLNDGAATPSEINIISSGKQLAEPTVTAPSSAYICPDHDSVTLTMEVRHPLKDVKWEYQWFDSEGKPILSATDLTYEATVNGNYTYYLAAAGVSDGTLSASSSANNWTIVRKASAHQFGSWETVSPSEDGSVTEERTCSRCGDTELRVTYNMTVPKAGQSGMTFKLPAIPDGAVYGSPTTTDTSFITSVGTISDRTLTFDVAQSSDGTTGKITIPVTGTSYSAYTMILNLTSAKVPVTIGVNPVDDTYDGTAKAGYTGEVTLSPAWNGTLDVTYYLADGTKTTTANSGAETEGGKPVFSGDYKLTFSIPESDVDYSGSTTVAFKIEKAPITIQWKNLTTVYDGNPQQPDVTEFTGKIGDEDVTVTVGSQTDAGSYPMIATLGGADKGNYKLTNPVNTFVIQKAPVEFAVTNDTAAYDKNAHSATVTATSGDADFTTFTVSYWKDGAEVKEPTEAGSYDIYAAINNPNYRHTDSVDGSARKIGVLTIYATPEPPKTYTVSFDGNGAEGTTAALEAKQRGAVRILPQSSFTAPEKQSFGGWSYGGKIYRPGERFTQPAADVTFVAVWNMNTYSISGTVTQDGEPVSNALVTLTLGSKQIEQTITDEHGRYIFTNAISGLYNLRAEKDGIIQTIAARISTASMKGQDIVLPAGKTNSIVQVAVGTPDVVVGELEKTFKDGNIYAESDKAAVAKGGSTEIIADVKVNTDDTIQQIIVKETKPNETVDLFIDVDLSKIVRDADGQQIGDKTEIKKTAQLLVFTLTLPGELQGKANYVVYREHEGVAGPLTMTANADGEFITVNSEKTEIVVHIKKFSTIGIGYTTSEITFDANGGSCDTATAITDGDGKLAEVPTATRSGSYRFGGWFTAANGGTEITTSTVFTANTTVFAHWTYTGGGGTTGYTIIVSVEGGGSDSTTYYTITTSAGEGGYFSTGTTVSVKAGESAGFTITANKGYVIADVLVDGKSVGAVSSYTFTNVRADHTISATFKIEGTHPNPQTGVELNTTDHFAYMVGYGNGAFGADNNITRAEVAVMFFRLLTKQMEANKDCPFDFTDITGSEWYADAVGYMTQLGIVFGYSDGTFGGDKPITRAKFADVASRFDMPSQDARNTFTDVPDGYWAKDYLASTALRDWVSGYTDGTFRPESYITHAAVMTIVNRILSRICDTNCFKCRGNQAVL